jgi:ATP-dependent RNA helicase RhlE
MSFDQLGLTPELLGAIADQGYTTPTPVQAEAIPLVLAGRDVLAGAQTGTGKTAAFVLPILQYLHATRPNGAARPGGRSPVRVLVLTPTRELALQVEESVRTYGARRPIRSTPVYGGVGFEGQVRALRAGPEIVVATPGRLLDHLGQRTLDLSSVEILVLDEADRMLDMGFIRDIRRIMALLPTRRQTLLFSATFSDEIRRLADDFLVEPASVQVAPRNMAAELVRQVVIRVDRERKRELLTELIRSGRVDQALVFTRTKHGANRLALQLARDGIAASAIHGNRSQSQRVRALEDFKRGRVSILVATEVAARGLDIDTLPHVVNFELPMVAEDYVHRIGRTGRAGAEGDAISLVCVDEGKLLAEIERVLGHRIPTEEMPGFEPDRSIRPEPILRRPALGSRPPIVRRDGRRPSGPISQPGVSGPRRPVPQHVAGRPVQGAGNRPAPGQSIGARAPQAGGPGGAQHRGPWRGGQRPIGERPGGPRTPRPDGNRHAGAGGPNAGRSGPNAGRSGPNAGRSGPQHGRPAGLPGERIARHGS